MVRHRRGGTIGTWDTDWASPSSNKAAIWNLVDGATRNDLIGVRPRDQHTRGVWVKVGRNWIRIIGIWQMVSGAIAGITFLDAMPRIVSDLEWRVSILAVVIPICGLSILAGYALYQGRRAGRTPSLIVQVVQLVGIGVGPKAIRLVLGPYVLIGLIPHEWIGVSVGWQSQLHLHLGSQSPGFYLNVLALVCIWYLAFEWPASSEVSPDEASPSPTPAV